ADAVAERVVVALVELLPRRLAALGEHAGLLERLARGAVDLAAVGARAHGGERALERLAGEAPPLGDLRGRLGAAADERARHVGPAAGVAVARPDVDDHRLAGADLAVAGLVPDRALRAVRHDHVVGQVAAARVACLLHRGANLLAGDAGLLADHPRGDAHRLVGRQLGAADAGDLGLGLHAAAGGERLGVDHQLDPARPQVI